MKHKIALIMPYFGRWPKWIDLYLKSCSLNTIIDFHFFTDCGTPKLIYKNTFFYNTTWDEYQNIISQKLAITYKRQNAYALCDVRPFYGFIYRELLEQYDFWGFGDIDVCYGNLSKFINDDLLYRKDVISMHADRVSGHFALFRNNKYYCQLCFKIPKWKEKLEGREMYGLDEHYFTDLIFPGIKNIHRAYRLLFSKTKLDYRKGYSLLMYPINSFSRFLFKECYTTPCPKNGEEWIYDLSNGSIIDPIGRELPYLHYLFFKKTPFYKTENYWKDYFYMISSDKINNNIGEIKFDIQGIK